MVIPKAHHPYVFEIEDQDLSQLWLAAKKVSEMLKKTFQPKSGKIGIIVYGMDVDHTHIHLVPLDKSGDLNFANAKSASKEQLEEILAKIKNS